VGEAPLPGDPPHLLAPGQRRLAGGELERRPPAHLDELVGHVQEGRIRRNPHLGADAEAADRRPRLQEPSDVVLVQAAAAEDDRVLEARGVEQRAGGQRQLGEIAGVEAQAAQPVAARGQLAADLDRAPDPLDRVVGVDEQDGAVGVGAGEGAEGLQLVAEGLYVGVSHGAGDGDPVDAPGEHVAGRVEPG